MFKDFIGKILPDLNTAFGITGEDWSSECELSPYFPSVKKLENPYFASSLVENLTKEIMKICGQTSTTASACPLLIQPTTEPQERNEDKTSNKMFSLWAEDAKVHLEGRVGLSCLSLCSVAEVIKCTAILSTEQTLAYT